MFENVRITTLPNGARVATSAMPGVNSFALSIRVSMGSRCERPSEAGWSHFAEHMAFAGSAGHPSRKAIVRALERIGGCYNAATSKELMRFLAIVPASGATAAVGVLGDMVSRPLYPEAEEIRTLAADFFRPENAVHGLILPHDCRADPDRLREVLFNG